MDLGKYELVDGEIHSRHRQGKIKYYGERSLYVRLVDENDLDTYQLPLERALLILRDGFNPSDTGVRFLDGDDTNYELDNLTWDSDVPVITRGDRIRDAKRKTVIARHAISRKDIVYSSLGEAALMHKTTPSTLCKAIKSKKQCKGYHWMYV
jgi:hypothetical protein